MSDKGKGMNQDEISKIFDKFYRAEGVNNLRSKTSSCLIITHYQRLLDQIVPDYVHVMANGRIVKSGGKSIAEDIELSGYKKFG